MLTIYGPQHRLCDGMSRRNFIRIGALGMGGLAMPQLLQAEKKAGIGKSGKSIIMIYLPGGPPHQDMYEIKTDAPSEIRGEFKPIKTNVPGIHICEHLPRLAQIADKLIFVRTIVGAKDSHSSYQCMTGRLKDNPPPGGWPEIGSVLSKMYGPAHAAVPPYVNLSPPMRHPPYNFGQASFLGVAHTPFRPEGDTREDMTLNGISLDRLADRRALLTSFDRFRRDADQKGSMAGLDAFNEQAFDVLTSSRLLEALDLQKEDRRIRERYGEGTPQHQGDAAPRLMGQFLLARRLVEAGVRCVTVSFSFWDWHGKNFDRGKDNLPPFDQGVSALVEDLHERGLDKDVTVIAWGEFGRTPKINKDGGRDHWPRVSCALLAGGGMRTGQAIGSTNRLGEEPKERPVHFQEVFATLYHNLGLNANQTQLTDLADRPHYLVDGHQPLTEVI
ncbi:MAG: DUF1501 domain-containing protein [Acidobacteria bacterium]|nr:DUF1501 domain-containing protein [Acidobacteriota bacterium]